jgi:hypothetical protein
MKKLSITGMTIVLLLLKFSVCAQNPIVPQGIYTADPAAHVAHDGKVYVYCSVDESFDYYCSNTYHVLSTSNMMNFDLFKNVFNSSGPNDEVDYTDHKLAAPGCIYKDGLYYLYYCTQDKKFREGVAVSKHPEGPFRNGKNLHVGKYQQIDPGAFIDDDSQAYYVWGQFSMKMAKLKPNMTEIDESTIKDNVLTEKEHFFHEGAHMVKRNGTYYLVYAHFGRADKPTCIGYATSKSPMGPYKYRGVIIDNNCSDPSVWNNHGSIIEYQDQWYVFYHRSTHGTVRKRRACVELIYFNEDGSIDEVEMTSQGAGPPLPATSPIDMYRACLLHGQAYLRLYEEGNEILTGIKDGDRAGFKYLDFKDGVSKVTVRVAPGKNPGKILIGSDRSWWGGNLGEIEIPATEAENNWQIITTELKRPVKGVRALWLTFNGEGKDLYSLDWVRFE